MDFSLSKSQKGIQKAAKEFAAGEFDKDLAAILDKEGRFPEKIWKKAARLGLVGVHLGGNDVHNLMLTDHVLVEMATEVKISKVFMEKLVQEHMAGKNIIVETSMGKYFSTDLVKRTALRCLELIGDFGSLEKCPVARTWRDSRVTSIFAGTNEVMKEIIARFTLS